jgi:hypothetical protein
MPYLLFAGPALGRTLFSLVPLSGILTFIILYAIAASRYPGGTKYDPATTGFSMRDNYWCDLLDPTAYNGQPNPARPVGVTATLLLAFCLSMFFYQLPVWLGYSSTRLEVIRYAGTIGLWAGACIFTSWHGPALAIGGLLTGSALLLFLVELQNMGFRTAFWAGVACIALGGLCYFMYYSLWQIRWLPILQKLTFLAFFVWIGWLNWMFFARWQAANVAH